MICDFEECDIRKLSWKTLFKKRFSKLTYEHKAKQAYRDTRRKKSF